MKDGARVRGRITATVYGSDGRVKRNRPGFWRRLLGLPGRPMRSVRHNIVTNQGDALIADCVNGVGVLQKVDASHGFIQVGTGWTGNSTKANTRCNVPTGAPEPLDAGYPALRAAYGEEGDNVVVYRATFEAGALAANGINEAALLNGTDGAALCLAYGQLLPSANVTAQDSLQVEWELSFLGT